MKHLRILAAIMLLLPFSATAEIEIDGVGSISNWFFHADLETMRNTTSGKTLYAWMEVEVFDELREETGLDIDRDVDTIIATSDGDDGVIIVADGRVTQDYIDKFMALAALHDMELAPRKAGKRNYYYVEGDDNGSKNEPFDNGAFFSFDVKNKYILTSSEDKIKELLGNGGKVDTRNRPRGTMLMFSAENKFFEAGIQTDNSNADWDSNLMKNTEEAGLLIADKSGKIGIEAQLVAREPEMADSLASIVRGLISLQVFNDELDPEIAELLQNTKVEVKDRALSISIALDPDVVVASLNE